MRCAANEAISAKSRKSPLTDEIEVFRPFSFWERELAINNNCDYTEFELKEAKRAINSTIEKCEKALIKQRHGSPQETLLIRRIKAFKISVILIDRAISEI